MDPGGRAQRAIVVLLAPEIDSEKTSGINLDDPQKIPNPRVPTHSTTH